MDSIKTFLNITLLGVVCGMGLGVALIMVDNADTLNLVFQTVFGEENEEYHSPAPSVDKMISGASAGKTTVPMFPYQLNCFGVKASVCGVERTFLVDTGCSYSMINKEVYEKLRKQGKMEGVRLYEEDLQMADNGITTMKWFYATFQIGDTRVTNAKCFIINDRTAKNILGMTALKGCEIDFDNRTLSFD